MPHIPRQPTGRPAAPTKAKAAGEDEYGTKARHRFGLEKLSLTKFDVDPADIYKHIFGKEPEIDGHTGGMVHSGPESGSPGAGANGAGARS